MKAKRKTGSYLPQTPKYALEKVCRGGDDRFEVPLRPHRSGYLAHTESGGDDKLGGCRPSPPLLPTDRHTSTNTPWRAQIGEGVIGVGCRQSASNPFNLRSGTDDPVRGKPAAIPAAFPD